MSNRRDFLKNTVFASIALALPTSIKPDSIVNLKQPDLSVLTVNGAERMRITSIGDPIGIGTIMPPYELKIRQTWK